METTTVAKFLLRRLKELGCDHIFGVPGDFVLNFFREIQKSDLEYIGTCNELNAAYAADGYARLKGIGCVSTTFNVGELSALNGVAGSYAERVPVVKISGIPSRKCLKHKTLLHHTLRTNTMASFNMYKEITVDQALLCNPETVVHDIDRVLLACLHHKSPVYIALPTDMVNLSIEAPRTPLKQCQLLKSNAAALEQAVEDMAEMIQQSNSPLLIPGIEIARRQLQDAFLNLTNSFNIPFSTMALSKTVIDENHDHFVGLYCGNICRNDLRILMDGVDCLVICGEILSDFNTGGFSSKFSRDRTIEIFYDKVQIKRRVYENVYIHDVFDALVQALKRKEYMNKASYKSGKETCVYNQNTAYVPDAEKRLTVARFFHRLSKYIQPNSIVVAETGVASFAAPEILMPTNVTYISQVYYGSIGYTLGATLGACCAAPTRHVILVIGDGSFQVVCQDLSSIIRYQRNENVPRYLPPTIFLLNNDGYTIERKILDGTFNDIQRWTYYKLPQVYGAPHEASFKVYTEGELEHALTPSTYEKLHPLLFIDVNLSRYSVVLYSKGCADTLCSTLAFIPHPCFIT